MCVTEAALQACSRLALRASRVCLKTSSWGDTEWDHDHQQYGPRHFGRNPRCGHNPERLMHTVMKTRKSETVKSLKYVTAKLFHCDRLVNLANLSFQYFIFTTVQINALSFVILSVKAYE